ncbi:MAG TPA: hypothetical protein VK689_18820 [Armatimonadota bacterium]|nr:hypothetical protein [Armatimonadota bacterium]
MSLPPEIDLSPRFAALGLPRRDQGKRPTCSVFTVAHALEYALAVAAGGGAPVSVEYLNWAARQGNGRTDDGGFFSEIWAGYEDHGSCPEALLPYRAEHDPGLQPDPSALDAARGFQTALRLEWIKEWDPETGVTPAQMERLRAVLASGNPICAGLRWPRNPVWAGEVLELCPPEAVFDGHSVLLIGYRADPALPGGGAFRIRNSNRPASGFLPYAYVSQYLNDAAWIAPCAAMEPPP